VTLRGLNFGAAESFPVATLGGLPCQHTQWLSDEAVACVVPPMKRLAAGEAEAEAGEGRGVRVAAHVTTCGCGEAAHEASSLEEAEEEAEGEEGGGRGGRPPALFSYDEAIVQQVRTRVGCLREGVSSESGLGGGGRALAFKQPT
jgi:hypothetical protein